jgi:hypothetical protein
VGYHIIVNRRTLAIVTLALLLGSVLAFAFHPTLYPPYAEGRDYVSLAKGDYSTVYNYYGGRMIHPLIVRGIARLAHVPIDAHVFRWVSVTALLCFFALIGVVYALEYGFAARIWLVLLVSPTLVDPYRNYYWHDLTFAALCAGFFLLLRSNVWFGLPLIFVLYLTRESALVLVAAVAVAAALRRQWRFCMAALAFGFAAREIESALVARSLPNNEGLPLLLLDFLKIPYNFAFNICGLEFWTNANAATLSPPMWTAHVPAWLHLGNIREIGYSGFSLERPAKALLTILTAFGILPLVVLRTMGGWRNTLNQRFDISVAFLYGVLMLFLSVLVGTGPSRYVLYAWPLFWLLSVSMLHGAVPDLRRRIAVVSLSLIASWVPAVVRLFAGPSVSASSSIATLSSGGIVISLGAVFAIYVFAWRLLATAWSQGATSTGILPITPEAGR